MSRELLAERGIAVDHVDLPVGADVHAGVHRRRPARPPRFGTKVAAFVDVTADAVAELAIGVAVWLSVKATEIDVYPAPQP
jgi:hypothetical protein